jgi:hypothetical protein
VTFPTVITEATSLDGSNGTTHLHTVPASLVNGNKILALIAFDAQSSPALVVTPPSNWTELSYVTDSQGFALGAYYRTVDGNEDTERTWTSSANERSACYMVQLQDADSFEFAAANGSGGTLANSPSLTPTGGAKDYLWFSVMAANEPGTVTGFPTSFASAAWYVGTGQLDTNLNPTSTADAHLAYARLARNAVSEDPTEFTHAASAWRAFTIAVHPAGEEAEASASTVGGLLNSGLN